MPPEPTDVVLVWLYPRGTCLLREEHIRMFVTQTERKRCLQTTMRSEVTIFGHHHKQCVGCCSCWFVKHWQLSEHYCQPSSISWYPSSSKATKKVLTCAECCSKSSQCDAITAPGLQGRNELMASLLGMPTVMTAITLAQPPALPVSAVKSNS